MKLLKFTMLAIAVFVASVSAQAQLLWKVSGNGLSKSSYIFGTHHVAPVSVIDSVTGLTDALAGVDKVYGEIDMEAMTQPAVIGRMQQMMMAPEGHGLSTLLSAAQLDSLTAVMQEYAGPMITAQMLDMLTPAAVTTQLAMLKSMKAFPDFNPQAQLDTEMQTRARALGKEVGGLETVEFQLSKLFGKPLNEQAADLMKALRTDAQATASAVQLANAYRAGDLALMYQLITDPATGMDDEEAENLLFSRNRAWVEFLAGAFPTASLMIVVGAGHLAGKQGLIELLKQKGYKVTPVGI